MQSQSYSLTCLWNKATSPTQRLGLGPQAPPKNTLWELAPPAQDFTHQQTEPETQTELMWLTISAKTNL